MTVRVHSSVLASDEHLVAVIQHEVYELSAVRSAIVTSPSGALSSARIHSLIDVKSDVNLHGRAWDVADLRVRIMRETDPVQKAMLLDAMDKRLILLKRMNGG